MSLFAGFHIVPGHTLLYSAYFFGEYAFGLMFIDGCRYLARGVSMTHRSYAMLIPAALLAIALPWFSADFNDLFMVQAIAMQRRNFFGHQFDRLCSQIRRTCPS